MSLKDELSRVTRTPSDVESEKEHTKQLKMKEAERQKQLTITNDAKLFYERLVENIKENASNGIYDSCGKTRTACGETWVGNDKIKYIQVYESTQEGHGVFRGIHEKRHNWELSVTNEGKLVYEAISSMAAKEGIDCELLIMCRRSSIGYGGKNIHTTSYYKPRTKVRGEWNEWQPYFTMCVRGKISY